MTTTFPFGRVRPIMLRVVIASLVVAAVVAIVSIATATFGETSWRLIATAVLFTAFALFSWYDADVSSKRSTPFALVSFAVSIYLFVAGMVKIWAPDRAPADPYAYEPWSAFDGFGGWLVVASIARVALLHVHLVLATGARLRYPVMSVVTSVTLVLRGHARGAADPALPVHVARPRRAVLARGGGRRRARRPRHGARAARVPALRRAVGARAWPSTRVGDCEWDCAGVRVPDWPLLRGLPAPGDRVRPRPGQRMLQWPRYDDGSFLPVASGGGPDFSGVVGYDDWAAQGPSRSD